MPKPLTKETKIDVYMTEEQKKKIRYLTYFHNKDSMSEYMLDCALNSSDSPTTISSQLEKQWKGTDVFQRKQQRTLFLMMQFLMYISGFSRSKEDVMKFFDNANLEADIEFGKEDE